MKNSTIILLRSLAILIQINCKKILIIESLVDDILQFSIRINNSVGEIFLLQPFQKKTIFIPCYFEEDIVKVKDDDEVEWNLLEFQKFRAFLA